MSNIIELGRKIKIPKNRIRMFTVDKDGKETGKSREFTNLWTSYGYENFWLPNVPNTVFSFTEGQNINFYLAVANGSSEITLSSIGLQGTVRRSINRVPVYNDLIYDRLDEVNINGKDYYKITLLKSFPHGNVNFDVGQVGIFSGNNNTTLMCGTRLKDEMGNFDPFPVTNDEQLNVMYSIYIPFDLTYPYQTDGDIWATVPVLINGDTPVDFNFRRSLYAYRSTGTTVKTHYFYMALNSWSSQDGTRCYYNNTLTYSNGGYGITRSNSGKKAEITYSYTMTPGQLPGVNINRFTMTHGVPPGTNGFLCTIDPPIVKGPDDRLSFSFKYTIEIDEEDF